MTWCEMKYLSYLEEDFKIFPKSRAVVIPDSLGITKALKQWRCLQDLFSDQIGGGFVDSGQVLHDQLGALCLASSGLSTDHNTLVLQQCGHPCVGSGA